MTLEYRSAGGRKVRVQYSDFSLLIVDAYTIQRGELPFRVLGVLLASANDGADLVIGAVRDTAKELCHANL